MSDPAVFVIYPKSMWDKVRVKGTRWSVADGFLYVYNGEYLAAEFAAGEWESIVREADVA